MHISKKNLVILFSLLALVIIPVTIQESYSLQQVAGPIKLQLKPGDTQAGKWGLLSDKDQKETLSIKSDGAGSEFLSFPNSITVQPHALVYVNITATIPSNYPGNVTLVPVLHATEAGQQGGATILDIQMNKFVTLSISPNPNPQFRTQIVTPSPTQAVTPSTQPTQQQTPTQNGLTISQPSSQQSSPQTTPVSQPVKPSRCLIATAAFGSDLSPQVQLLRDFRDNHILSTAAGSQFMQVFNAWYYSFSPYVADYERQQPWMQQIVRVWISPLLAILEISEKPYNSINGEFGALTSGLIASSLIGAVYFSPIALSVKQVRKNKFNRKLGLYLILAVSSLVVLSIISANPYALMITTSLFVLTVLSISAILVAKTLCKFAPKLRKIIQ